MIPLTVVDGFIVCFEALSEEVDMQTHFISDCGWTQEQYAEIENYSWFCAKVSAWKDANEVASAYLGACCYKTVNEFYTTYKDDYLAQMIAEALEDAKRVVQ